MIELHSSKPSEATLKRVTRMMMDAKVLKDLSRAEARAVYDYLEATRDALSSVLDRADGKTC